MIPVVALCVTAPESAPPLTPNDTPPAAALTMLSVALAALRKTIADTESLSVVIVPPSVMEFVPPPPLTVIVPPMEETPLPSALMLDPDNWLIVSPAREMSPLAVMLLAPMTRVPTAPVLFAVAMRTPPVLDCAPAMVRPPVVSLMSRSYCVPSTLVTLDRFRVSILFRFASTTDPPTAVVAVPMLSDAA